MSTSLYIVSTETFSGKSALCVGLGKRFIADGLRVGYMKPVSVARVKMQREVIEEDVAFVRDFFGLGNSLESLCPIRLSSRLVKETLCGEKQDFGVKLAEAYQQVAKDKDIVILEGANNWTEGAIVGLRADDIAELLDCKVIVVAYYRSPLVVDKILSCRNDLGSRMVGVVLNEVPHGEIETANSTVKQCLEYAGIKVLAVLPEDSVMRAIAVGELAFHLSGRILCCHEKADDLVENLAIGAMTMESALHEFRRVHNKAVITGGDRTDIILAALETSTKALILTGNLQPHPVIISHAEEQGVPIILVPHDTFTAVEIIEQFFGRSSFQQERKVVRFQAMLDRAFDFAGLRQSLGL
jgi:uncharacterized protein